MQGFLLSEAPVLPEQYLVFSIFPGEPLASGLAMCFALCVVQNILSLFSLSPPIYFLTNKQYCLYIWDTATLLFHAYSVG